jgi:hypothetical protein
MTELVANVCLVFLGISLIITYIAVRLNWLKWQIAGLSGYVSSAIFLYLFAILKGNGTPASLMLGVGMGFIFTLLSVVMGIFFRVNREA